jgi:hypothetical protein
MLLRERTRPGLWGSKDGRSGGAKMGFFDLLWGWADDAPKDWSGPPRSVEEEPTRFVVRDHDGQKLAYVDFEDRLDRRLAAKLPTKAEARRIAFNIAKLPRLSDLADSKTVKYSWF